MSNGYGQAMAITMPAGLGCIAVPVRVRATKVTPLGGHGGLATGWRAVAALAC